MDEVVTFFHEFGHAIDALADQRRTTRTGTGYLRQDFVEAPVADARELDVAAVDPQAGLAQREDGRAAAPTR